MQILIDVISYRAVNEIILNQTRNGWSHCDLSNVPELMLCIENPAINDTSNLLIDVMLNSRVRL